ncbi:hypothetical protein TSUD_384960 [Trifolium subterraneum]|uniref:Uncharacterized protein n=1 Tax=Trifolium subterraneum TaxID=3900 RepID=A0A2Z6N2N8_TRISU|nr:hypothetical protein TSUD_384960 [Trifolium subterraneum]
MMMMKNSKGRMKMKVDEMSEKQLVESNNSVHKSKEDDSNNVNKESSGCVIGSGWVRSASPSQSTDDS